MTMRTKATIERLALVGGFLCAGLTVYAVVVYLAWMGALALWRAF